jgi:hypothetical protein
MSDCDRRVFLKAAALGSATMGGGAAAPPEPEALVRELWSSLSADQKRIVALPFDHPLRRQVDHDWQVVAKPIGEIYKPPQQSLIEAIFRGLYNPAFADRAMRPVQEDGGGLAKYSAAIFGDPSGGPFQFVLAGNHCTLRCGGDSVRDAAFGGPVFYGHAVAGPANVYAYQSERANEVLRSLDPRQRQHAWLNAPPPERAAATVALKKPGNAPAGVLLSDLSREQRKPLEPLLADLVLPFRQRDAARALECIRVAGGVEALSMAFFPGGWQLESPAMVWSFRGQPHVHAWVYVSSV